MSKKRLSILIPTYNRESNLRLLLETLSRELAGIENLVGIVVSNNGSTDGTHEVIMEFSRRLPNIRVIRHKNNVGMDRNFCGCVEADDSEYFWLIGDDDLPRSGAIRYLLDLLAKESPDLVYMESDWRFKLEHNSLSGPMPKVAAIELSKLAFARRVNVWTTFISGMIIKRSTFVEKASRQDLRKYSQTNLVQLSWILPTLERAKKLLYIPESCVFATAGNTGGYAVLKVFGEYFPSIVKQQFGVNSSIGRAMILRNALGYLPVLAWQIRVGQAGNFTKEQTSVVIACPELSGRLEYYVILIVTNWPMPFALCVRLLCSTLARLLRIFNGLLDSVRLFGISRER